MNLKCIDMSLSQEMLRVYDEHCRKLLDDANAKIKMLEDRVPRAALFAFLEHGDDEHKAWLREAIDAFYEGRPRPAPRSKQQKESA